VHNTGARVIAKAAKEAGVKRLIHVSALNASEDSPSKFLQSKVKLLPKQSKISRLTHNDLST